MRLIDADELIVMEFGGIKFVPKEFIDAAQTVEPKNGTWRKGDDGWVSCSVCGILEYPLNDEWRYCPHCGARMEET